MPDVDLEFIDRKLDRVLAEIASFRETVDLEIVIIRRLDDHLDGLAKQVDGLKQEVRAGHGRHDRLEKRVRTLEERS